MLLPPGRLWSNNEGRSPLEEAGTVVLRSIGGLYDGNASLFLMYVSRNWPCLLSRNFLKITSGSGGITDGKKMNIINKQII